MRSQLLSADLQMRLAVPGVDRHEHIKGSVVMYWIVCYLCQLGELAHSADSISCKEAKSIGIRICCCLLGGLSRPKESMQQGKGQHCQI
jgi:hypothetical protein